MRVIVANSAGFCMGVRRAINKTFITLGKEKGPLFTHGPLIHNPQVIELLNERGVLTVENGKFTGAADGIIIIRAHGISPDERITLRKTGLRVVDATCPKVARIHAEVKKYKKFGYFVIVVGDRDHPEVQGILGYTDGKGRAVNAPEEALKLPSSEKVLVVAQTTFEKTMFENVLAAIKERYRDSEILAIDTICDSTKRRQDEVRALAQKVDAIVVVGGKTSGNTKRLFEVARESGLPAYSVEDESELNPKDFYGYKVVGLTAGASTPNWVIMRVYEYLASLGREEGSSWSKSKRLIWSVTDFLVLSNMYAALAAGGLAVMASLLLGIKSFWMMPAISALFIFAMLVLNRTHDIEAAKFNDPRRGRFLEKGKKPLVISGVLSLLGAYALGILIHPFALLLLIGATVLGVAYSVKVMPVRLSRFTRYRRLKDIPASKTFFVATAWAAIATAMPYFSAIGNIPFGSFVSVFLFCFLLVFIRATLYDIRDIQGDAVVGRETIPIVIGKSATQWLVIILSTLASLLLIFSAAVALIPALGFWLILVPLYAFCTLYLYHRRVIFQGISFEIVVDFEFIMGGILSWICFYIS